MHVRHQTYYFVVKKTFSTIFIQNKISKYWRWKYDQSEQVIAMIRRHPCFRTNQITYVYTPLHCKTTSLFMCLAKCTNTVAILSFIRRFYKMYIWVSNHRRGSFWLTWPDCKRTKTCWKHVQVRQYTSVHGQQTLKHQFSETCVDVQYSGAFLVTGETRITWLIIRVTCIKDVRCPPH